MKYQDLSSDAKQKALERFSENCFADWHDDVIEDAKEQGKEKGFDVVRVYYSGFCSQGGGASWAGRVDLKQYLEAHPDPAPSGPEFFFRELIRCELYFENTVRVSQNGHYCHEHTMQVDSIEEMGCDDDASMPDGVLAGADVKVLAEQCQGVAASFDTGILEAVRDYAREIYRRLEAEYEYQVSEEALLEAAEANEWGYDEDGELL